MAKRKITKTDKKMRSKFARKSANIQKLKAAKSKEEKFLDEDSAVIVEDARVSHPDDYDVRSAVSELDGFRDWARESRGNGLTFGDY